MRKADMPQALADLLSALGLLTRLPLPRFSPRGAEAAWAWPLAGLVVGTAQALSAGLALWIGLPAGVAAALALAVGAAATGALHEDGLADTVDGLFGGWTAERRLEIMKDSRIGSFGALALMLSVLARWSALVALIGAGWHWEGLMAAGLLSRVPMAAVMAVLPPARPGGLSRAVGRPALTVVAAGGALALLLAMLLSGWAALGAALLAGLVTAGLAQTARARIGGQTGDILGAAQQVSEISVLAVLAGALA